MNESAYRFDDFCVIPARRELWHAGQRLTVQPKVLDTLIYLMEHRDRVVGRDELVSAVWGLTDINDNVLSQIIRRGRRIVGDTREGQHYIRTLPRFGYRWVRAVETSCVASDSPEADSAAPSSVTTGTFLLPVARMRDRWRLPASAMLLGVLVLSGSAALTFVAISGNRTSDATAEATALPLIDRLAKLNRALALDQLDLARAIFRTLSDQDRIAPAVRHAAALLALHEGRADEASAAFTALLADLDDSGDRMLVGQVLFGAGRAASRREQQDDAQRHYEQAVVALEGDTRPEARAVRGRVWTHLGRLQFERNALDAAERAYAQAGAALEGAGDLAALAQWESNVGVLMIGRYRHIEALPRFKRAAELAAQADDVSGEARARMNLVNAHLALLQPAAALASEPRLRALRERLGDPWLAANVDLVRVKALTASGQLGAAELVMRAHAGRPKPTDSALMAFRDVVAAELAFARGALDAGSRHASAALSSPWYVPESGIAAYARYRLLMARQALGDTQGLVAAAEAADAQSSSRPTEPTVRLYALLARGQASAAQGDLAAARAGFTQALAQAETNGVPFDLVHVAAAYARFLVTHGATVEAGRLADRIAAWAEQDYTASLAQLVVYHATGDEAWRAALTRTRRLAGERPIPPALTAPPSIPRSGERVLVASHSL